MYADRNILYFNENSGNVVFNRNGMRILNIDWGGARNLLEVGLKSSKMSATMVDQKRKIWVVEQLEW